MNRLALSLPRLLLSDVNFLDETAQHGFRKGCKLDASFHTVARCRRNAKQHDIPIACGLCRAQAYQMHQRDGLVMSWRRSQVTE